jgi:hypothetical protein
MAKKARATVIEREFEFSDSVRTFPNSIDADPNVIGRALWKISDANGGRLDPEKAVEDARAHIRCMTI